MEQLNENQLKVKRAETMMQIGEFYYKKFRELSTTPDEEVMSLIDMVINLDLQIAQVTGACIEQQGVCPSCGTEIGENSLFCQNCGFSLKEHADQFIGNCTRCGAKIRKGQNYCDVCGIQLNLQ